jgi:hypothetical protein
MVPKYLVERIEAILRGPPLPARRSEREHVREVGAGPVGGGRGASRKAFLVNPGRWAAGGP